MAGRKITVKVDADDSGYKRGLKRVEKDTRSFGGKMKGAFASLKGGVAGVLAAVGGAILGLGASIKDAAEDADQAVMLADGLRKVADASKVATDAAEEWISATSIATGVADSELRPALLRLATVTGDVQTAQDLLNLSMDIAAQTGKPLEGVAKAVGKAYAGQRSPLEKLTGLTLKAGSNAGTWSKNQKLLNDKFGGAAQKRAATYTGTVERLNVAFDEAVEALGTELLPLLQEFADYLNTPEGKQDLKDLAQGIKDIGAALRDVVRWFKELDASLPDWLDEFISGEWVENALGRNNGGGGFVGPSGGGSSWERNASARITVVAAVDPQQTARAVQRLVNTGDVRAGRKRFG
jgi:hypothetical protein